MMTPRTALGRWTLGSLMVLALALLPGLAPGEFDRSQRKCTDLLNKGLERVASAQGKLNRDCLRQGRLGNAQRLGPGGTIESCLTDDPKLRVAKQRQKTIENAIKRCETPLPPFGSTDADTVNDAAMGQKFELLHDIFNIDLNASIILKDPEQEGSEQNRTSRCQEEIAIRTDKCMNTRLTEFRKCATNGIRGGKLSLLYPDADNPFDDPRDIERCLSWDRRSKILSRCEVALDSKVNARCPDFTRELAAPAPGACHDAEDLPGCLDRLVRCRTCIAVNQADDLSIDCDLFDDCRTNGTCPPVLPICGDEITQVAIGETCDDGNTDSGDGCSASCQIESGAVCPSERAEPSVCGSSCGNGVLEESESCDDGNLASGDGCDSHCDFEPGAVCQRGGSGPSICVFSCGNGIIDEDECCDGGNLTDGDGCTANCQLEEGYTCDDVFDSCEPICGDGLVFGTEECDDRDQQDGDGCSRDCELEPGFVCHAETLGTILCEDTCGDENLTAGEACDDGNPNDGDGCSRHCQLEPGAVCHRAGSGPGVCIFSCGNGALDADEVCDDGNLTNADGCSENCQIEAGYSCTDQPSVCGSICGDGFVRGNEQCDDRNTADADGCSSTCEVEPGSACEEGPLAPSVCVFTCGDGVLDPAEECDDSNLTEGDGCSDNCQIELAFSCSGEPSVCDPSCGDGLVRGNEECDDGGTQPNDGCDGSCLLEPGAICHGGETGPSICVFSCGNGVLDPNESCDDGAEVFEATLDGASEIHPVQTSAAGTGRFNLDPNNALVYTVVTSDLENITAVQIHVGLPEENGPVVFTLVGGPQVFAGKIPTFTVGQIDQLRGGELYVNVHTVQNPNGEIRGQIVDGIIDLFDGDGCSDRCETEAGYSCEGEPSTCGSVCGDGLVIANEECDDGGTQSSDGCSSTCAIELGAVCQGEPSICVFSCGNGVLDPGETCDDGNTINADGCSDSCQSETP